MIIKNHCGERDMIYRLLLSLRVITPLLSIEQLAAEVNYWKQMVSSALLHLGLGAEELVMLIDYGYPRLQEKISLLQRVSVMVEFAIGSMTRIRSRLKSSRRMYLPSAIPDRTGVGLEIIDAGGVDAGLLTPKAILLTFLSQIYKIPSFILMKAADEIEERTRGLHDAADYTLTAIPYGCCREYLRVALSQILMVELPATKTQVVLSSAMKFISQDPAIDLLMLLPDL